MLYHLLGPKNKREQNMITYQNPSLLFTKNAVFSLERSSRISHLHWHEAIEFVFVLNGSLNFRLNSNTFEAKAGDLVVVNSAIVHSFSPTEEGADYYFLVADDKFFRTNGLYLDNTVFDFKINTSEGCRLFGEIIRETEKGDEYSKISTLSVLMSLFIYLNRHHSSGKEESPLSEQKKITMVRGALVYIQEHYKEKLTVDEISEALHFSKSYLSHSFKEITHVSLISYINLLRCQNARALMLEGSSVAEAAMECGFTELSYFTRVFKKTLGMLPSDAREEIFTLNNRKS